MLTEPLPKEKITKKGVDNAGDTYYNTKHRSALKCNVKGESTMEFGCLFCPVKALCLLSGGSMCK